MISRRTTGIVMALVIVVAVSARAFHLADRVVWFDEAISLLVARAPSVGAAFVAARDEGHGPLFNLVLHCSTWAQPGEIGFRCLSVLLGVATVGVVWAIGERLAGHVVGIVSALILALCPLHVWYSQEIRMYALQVLLIALSYLFLLMALKQERAGVWSLYVLVTALSLYAQYTSFLSVAAQNIYIILVRRRHRDSLKAWGMAQAAIALLFLPWLSQLLGHLQEKAHGYWIRPLTWDMPVKFFSLLSGSYLTNESGRWMVVAITLAVLAVTLVVVWNEQGARDRALLLTLWLFVPVVLLVLVSLRQNLFLPRVILYVAPAFALLMGLGVDRLLRLSQRVLALAVLGILFTLNLHALYGYYTHSNEWVKSPLRTISALIAREFRPRDIVVHSSQFSYRPLQFYLNQNVRQGLLVATEKRPGLLGIIGTGQMPHNSAQYRRIWLVVFPDFLQSGPPLRVVDWMNAHHRLRRVVLSSETLYVGLYERGDAPLGPP